MNTLPKKSKPTTINLLINAKLLLNHAISHSFLDSVLDRMIAILGIDHTNEYILNTIAEDFEIDIKSIELSEIAGEINKYLKNNYEATLPYLRDIKYIRSIRNLVQHGQSDPNPTDLNRYIKTTEKFFEKILSQLWGLSKEQIFVSSIIENDLVKSFILESEKYLDSKKEDDIIKSVVACRDAFENQLLLQTEKLPLSNTVLPVLMENQKNSSVWFYQTLYNQLLLTSLGVDINKYNRFVNYMAHLPSKYRPYDSISIVMQRAWINSDLKFCYSFVTELIMKWQNEQFPPLYQFPELPKSDKVYSSEEIFCDIDTTNFNSIPHFFTNVETRFRRFLLNKQQKEMICKIELDREYDCHTKYFTDGKLDKQYNHRIKPLNRYHWLLAHNPEKWEVIISYTILS